MVCKRGWLTWLLVDWGGGSCHVGDNDEEEEEEDANQGIK